MKILYDHQAFSEQTYGGISRYYAELIAGVNRTPENQARLSLLFSNNVHLHEIGLNGHPFFPSLNVPKKAQVMYRLNKLYNSFSLAKGEFDIFHTTNYNPYFIPYLKKKPFVVTFYDMIHERFAGQYPELGDVSEVTAYKKQLASQATSVIAISESTKRDIVEFCGIDPAKIQVVYLGSSFQVTPSARRPDSENPYLLYVGKRDAYKNFPRFLKAISGLLKTYKLRLICAGGGSFTTDEQQLVRTLDVAEFVEQKRIDGDESLQALYGSAQAFIFPSLYEGFGIPVLEAFSCGCPCILSNTSSLPEVAAEAALYFDPTCEDSIAESVEQLLTDRALRSELIAKGENRLEQFSWNRTVAETLAVYRTCL